ncbi:NAD(P)H-binding protein [Rugosimonospora africana]|uniref:Nucleotide-diphosphate-sugar epimerase n=1 Tax=Rugosimonospora africana TaxID=556532 RepID=A0A8J3QPS9_9ACTN|nr:NAD(P)H-binding protein [Rugosimonospora africana]GIH14239.1 nucleotide-diphosphate-sugar epimerase [Rugosimonospora africana]
MILVTGATGNVGRHVVAQLRRAGEPIRALTRDPAGKTLPDGVEVATGDLARPETLAPAFAGVDRMLLLPHAETARDVVALARQAGVRRIVALSSSAVDTTTGDPTYYANAVYLPVEHAVQQSGLMWTLVRGGEFMANTLGWAGSIRDEHVVRELHGDVRGVPVHEADVADVAVAALLEDGHAGSAYAVTGPAPITRREQVRVIGDLLGHELRFVDITLDQARERWRGLGVPDDAIEYIIRPPGSLSPNSDPVSPDYQRAVGRPGRTYAQWVADNLDAFR